MCVIENVSFLSKVLLKTSSFNLTTKIILTQVLKIEEQIDTFESLMMILTQIP
jgi:hypothetical protein